MYCISILSTCSALQRETDIPGFETTLVTCLERVFKTKYGASLIPHYMVKHSHVSIYAEPVAIFRD